LPLLDAFLDCQREFQTSLLASIQSDDRLTEDEKDSIRIRDHFRLLQATDNLSLLACVDYRKPATLLHALPINDGSYQPITVEALGERRFRLDPYPFAEPSLNFVFPARHVEGKVFANASELALAFMAAPEERLEVQLTAD
jgi:hypothetical protein